MKRTKITALAVAALLPFTLAACSDGADGPAEENPSIETPNQNGNTENPGGTNSADQNSGNVTTTAPQGTGGGTGANDNTANPGGSTGTP